MPLVVIMTAAMTKTSVTTTSCNVISQDRDVTSGAGGWRPSSTAASGSSIKLSYLHHWTAACMQHTGLAAVAAAAAGGVAVALRLCSW